MNGTFKMNNLKQKRKKDWNAILLRRVTKELNDSVRDEPDLVVAKYWFVSWIKGFIFSSPPLFVGVWDELGKFCKWNMMRMFI